MYKVVCKFADLLDSNHIYEVGVEYPRKGYSPSSDRIEELSTDRNKLHRPLIELVPEKENKVVQAVVQEPKVVVQDPDEVVGEIVQEQPKRKRTRK